MGRKWARFLVFLCISVPLIYFLLLVRSNHEPGLAGSVSKALQLPEQLHSAAQLTPSTTARYDYTKPCAKDLEILVRKCEIIHIALICAGYNASRAAAILIKSLLFYRKNPIHLHLITDAVARNILHTLFESWNIPHLKVCFYSADNSTTEIAWVPNKHYSGMYGLLKLTLPNVLPSWLERVIVLDCDVTFASDVAELWATFASFQSSQAIGLVENQSDWYLGKLFKTYEPWPALGRGFNTGVMAMDLKKLRNLNWSQMWRLTAEKVLISHLFTTLADQDILNAVLFHEPHLVHRLPCQFNVQLSDNTRSELCYTEEFDLKIVHWNSPKKLKVKNKHSEFFRNLYYTFVGFDGNLLRRQLFHCNETNAIQPSEEPQLEDDPCYELKRAQSTKYRTHLYYLNYEADKLDGSDVTWVAQLSLDRLQMIEPLARLWPGAISLALYLSDAEAQQLQYYVYDSDYLSIRKNIAYHVVYKQGQLYPINLLRNIALDQAQTPYVFLSDIDFLPIPNIYSLLKKSIQNVNLSAGNKALVVPAFETQRYQAKIPRSKADLIAAWELGDLFTFRYHDWPRGHAPTNYPAWRSATAPYKVKWELDFEPYIVVKRHVTRYDERFAGFGWNKVSHVMELHAQNFEFHVLPNAFVVHLPHSPSIDISKYRSSARYRKCADSVKADFVRDLKQRYNFTLVS